MATTNDLDIGVDEKVQDAVGDTTRALDALADALRHAGRPVAAARIDRVAEELPNLT